MLIGGNGNDGLDGFADYEVVELLLTLAILRGVMKPTALSRGRSAAELAAALSRSHRATAGVMLEHLSESAVKAVCGVYGIPATGRRGNSVRALLRAERTAEARRAGNRSDRRPRAKNLA